MSEQVSSEQISDKLNENTPNQEIKNTSRNAVHDNEKIAEQEKLFIEENFSALFEEYEKDSQKLTEGTVVKGVIVGIS